MFVEGFIHEGNINDNEKLYNENKQYLDVIKEHPLFISGAMAYKPALYDGALAFDPMICFKTKKMNVYCIRLQQNQDLTAGMLENMVETAKQEIKKNKDKLFGKPYKEIIITKSISDIIIESKDNVTFKS